MLENFHFLSHQFLKTDFEFTSAKSLQLKFSNHLQLKRRRDSKKKLSRSVSKSIPSLLEDEIEYDRNGVYIGPKLELASNSSGKKDFASTVCAMLESLPRREFIEKGYEPSESQNDSPRKLFLPYYPTFIIRN